MRDGRQALEIGGDRLRVGFREMGKRAPRHDRRELAAVRPSAGLERRRDLRLGPFAEPGLRIRRQIRRDEGAEAGDFKAHVRTAEIARHIRLAEKISRRVAVETTAEGHEIFAAFDGLLVGSGRGSRRHQRHRRSRDQKPSSVPHHVPSGMLELCGSARS